MTHDHLALVTGASSGIGLELALLLSDHDHDLVLTAEDPGLEAAAARCRAGGAAVTTVQADLRDPASITRLTDAVAGTGRPLDVAVLNAGVGRGGAFVETPLEQVMEVVDLNVASTVRLAHAVLGPMVRRGSGRVLLVSSIAATMPGAYAAVYNASKSFVQSFAEALVEELSDTDVTVTSLMPGPTETNFFERAGMAETKVGQSDKDPADLVARQGFDALMAGKDKVVAGSLGTKAQELASKVLPDRLKSAGHASMATPPDA